MAPVLALLHPLLLMMPSTVSSLILRRTCRGHRTQFPSSSLNWHDLEFTSHNSARRVGLWGSENKVSVICRTERSGRLAECERESSDQRTESETGHHRPPLVPGHLCIPGCQTLPNPLRGLRSIAACGGPLTP